MLRRRRGCSGRAARARAVSALNAAILTAWVLSLVSVSSRIMSGLCSASGIFAGIAFAAARACSSVRRGADGASSDEGGAAGDDPRSCFLVTGAGLLRLGQDLTCSAVPAGAAVLPAPRDHEPSCEASHDGYEPSLADGDDASARA